MEKKPSTDVKPELYSRLRVGKLDIRRLLFFASENQLKEAEEFGEKRFELWKKGFDENLEDTNALGASTGNPGADDSGIAEGGNGGTSFPHHGTVSPGSVAGEKSKCTRASSSAWLETSEEEISRTCSPADLETSVEQDSNFDETQDSNEESNLGKQLVTEFENWLTSKFPQMDFPREEEINELVETAGMQVMSKHETCPDHYVELFSLYVQSQSLELKKNIIQSNMRMVVEEHVNEQFGDVELGLNSSWLKLKRFDVEELYFIDDPVAMSLIRAMQNGMDEHYRKLKMKKVGDLFNVIKNLQICGMRMLNKLSKSICFIQPSGIEKTFALGRKFLEAKLKECRPEVNQRVEEIEQAIQASLRELNTERIKQDKIIAERAVIYATDKYRSFMMNQVSTTEWEDDLKQAHVDVFNAVTNAFYNVPEFYYTDPWDEEKLKESTKTVFDELLQARVLEIEAKLNEKRNSETIVGSQKDADKDPVANMVFVCKNSGIGTADEKVVEIAEPNINAESEDSQLGKTEYKAEESTACEAETADNTGKSTAYKAETEDKVDCNEGVDKSLQLSSNVRPGSSFDAYSEKVKLNERAVGGVSLIFSESKFYVTVRRFNGQIKNFHKAPYIRLVGPPYDIPSMCTYNGDKLNLYEFLTNPHCEATMKNYCCDRNTGRNDQLYAEEILALFFLTLRERLEKYDKVDPSSVPVTMGLPSYVSSVCKKRLKTALKLAGFLRTTIVQMTTAIGIGYLGLYKAVKNETYVMTAYMDRKCFEVAIMLHSNSHLRVLGLSTVSVSCIKAMDPFQIEYELRTKLQDAVVSALASAAIVEGQIQFCTVVADLDAVGLHLNLNEDGLYNMIQQCFQYHVSIKVVGAPASTCRGLLAVSEQRNTRDLKCYEELLPYSVIVKNVRQRKNISTEFLVANGGQSSKSFKRSLYANQLGSEGNLPGEGVSSVITRYSKDNHPATVESDLYSFRLPPSAVRKGRIEFHVSAEGILEIYPHPEDIYLRGLDWQFRYFCMPSDLFNMVKEHAQMIVNKSSLAETSSLMEGEPRFKRRRIDNLYTRF